MTRISQEQLKNKFSLVYEYNKQSPLFVRVAENEIDNNNFHTAIKILTDGIEYFPDYPTAFIMLGKAFIRIGEYEKAEEAFVKGCDLINSKRTLDYYINELEKTKRIDLLYLASKRIPFIPENYERIISQDKEAQQQAIDVSDKTTFEDKLEDIAKEMSTSKFVVEDKDFQVHVHIDETARNTEEQIVTETLAKILMSQSKFKEAIEVYKKLLTKSPDKKAYFSEKIAEIESQIDSGGW